MEDFKFTPETGLMDGTHYPNPKSPQETRAQFQRPLNQIRDFINKMLRIIPDEKRIIEVVTKSVDLTTFNEETGELIIGNDATIAAMWEAEY